MKRFLAPLVGAFLLVGCGRFSPPSEPTGQVWGLTYTLTAVPAESLVPLLGKATGFSVQIDERRINSVFILAHELSHVWQWKNGLLLTWIGQPCAVQTPEHCGFLGVEAHADAVGLAVLHAGCLPGDLGLPGQPVSGCVLPDPATVRP